MLKIRVLTALVLLAVLLPVLFLNNFPAFAVISMIFFAAALWESFRLCSNAYPIVIAAFGTVVFGFLLVSGNATGVTKLCFGCGTLAWLVFTPFAGNWICRRCKAFGSRFLAGFTVLPFLAALLRLLLRFDTRLFFCFRSWRSFGLRISVPIFSVRLLAGTNWHRRFLRENPGKGLSVAGLRSCWRRSFRPASRHCMILLQQGYMTIGGISDSWHA